MDFSSLADPRPYWVQFFDTGPSLGSWVSEAQVTPWTEGPPWAAVRDSRRRNAVRLAEAAGALSSALGTPAKRARSPALESPGEQGKPRARPRREPAAPVGKPTPVEEELSQQVGEMRELIAAARERQRLGKYGRGRFCRGRMEMVHTQNLRETTKHQ